MNNKTTIILEPEQKQFLHEMMYKMKNDTKEQIQKGVMPEGVEQKALGSLKIIKSIINKLEDEQ